MKAVSNIHPSYTKSGRERFPTEYGRKLKSIDESADYDVDEAVLFKARDGLYTYLRATGCSCWDGDYEGWAELTTVELKTMAEGWVKSSYQDTELSMGKWVLRYVK
jgi:hypothetical protein